MKQIRDVLGDDTEHPRYLQTIPRRGYRFIASVNPYEPARHPIQFVTLPGGGAAADRRSDLTVLSPEREVEHAEGSAVATGAAERSTEMNWGRATFLAGAVAFFLVVAAVAWRGWHHRDSATLPKPIERQLTANPSEDYITCAAVSPDGRYVAYVDQTGLLMRSVYSGEIRAISLPADFPASQIWEIRWFPEEGQLLITRRASVSEETSIWTVAVLGEAAPRRLRRDTSSPAISPDGKSMVFKSGALHQPKEIWISGLNGEEPRKLAAAEEGQGFGSPVWSPDGQWVAYERRKRNGAAGVDTSIQIQPSSGGPARTLLAESSLPPSHHFGCNGFDCLSWTREGTFIFTVEENSGRPAAKPSRSLWRIRVNPTGASPAGKPQELARWGDFGASSETTTADGRILAYVKGRLREDVYVTEINPRSSGLGTPIRLTLDNHDSFPEAGERNDRSLLFVSDRNGKMELFKQEINKSVPEKLISSAEGDLGFGNGPSPDGEWILYWEIPRAENNALPSSVRLMRQPSGGGPAEKVFEIPYVTGVDTDFACPQEPGNACVVNSWEGKNLLFYSLDPVQGKGDLLGKIEVDRNWAVAWALSPNGSEIAVVDHSHRNHIEIFNLSDRTWHEIATETGYGDFQSLAWAADGKSFFVTTFLPESFNLIRVALSGKVRMLLNNAQKQWMTRPLASPDGKYLAFQAQSWDANVWLMEDY